MVWERLGLGGGELLLALAIADRADDLGGSIFKSARSFAFYTRQSERTVRRQLARFRAIGWLQVVEVGGLRGQRRRATRYQINPLWITGAILSGVPEATRDNLAGVEEKTATGGTRPLTPVAATPVTGVTQSVLIHPRSEEASRRASPTGSRAAKKGKREVPPRTPEERIAACRQVLTVDPDFPHDRLRQMLGVSDAEIEAASAPSSQYSAAGA